MKKIFVIAALLAPTFGFAATGQIGSGGYVAVKTDFPVFGGDGDTLAEINCWGMNGYTAQSPFTVILKPSINYRTFEGRLNLSEAASIQILLVDLKEGNLLRLTLQADEQEPISSETHGLDLGLSRGIVNVKCKVNMGDQISDL